jgi:hypothetical protein
MQIIWIYTTCVTADAAIVVIWRGTHRTAQQMRRQQKRAFPLLAMHVTDDLWAGFDLATCV